MARGVLFDGLELELDPRSFEVGGAWGKDGKAHDAEGSVRFFYEKMLALEHVRFLDIGASTGLFCLLTKFHPDALAAAYEPSPEPWEILAANIKLNGLTDRVSAHCIAIAGSNKPRILKVPTARWNSGVACLGDNPVRFQEWEETKVVTRCLNSLHRGLGKVDIVKIDTEGCERAVLWGGREFFIAQHPDILIEFNAKNTAQFGYDPGRIIKLLNEFGYYHFEFVGMEDLWVTQ